MINWATTSTCRRLRPSIFPVNPENPFRSESDGLKDDNFSAGYSPESRLTVRIRPKPKNRTEESNCRSIRMMVSIPFHPCNANSVIQSAIKNDIVVRMIVSTKNCAINCSLVPPRTLRTPTSLVRVITWAVCILIKLMQADSRMKIPTAKKPIFISGVSV